KLKPGTVMEVEAIYDNSDANFNNPNHPPRLVTIGEQTTNEMCFVFLGATSDGPGRSPFARPSFNFRKARDGAASPLAVRGTAKPAAGGERVWLSRNGLLIPRGQHRQRGKD